MATESAGNGGGEFLDGLAGRSGDGPEHASGTSLRQSLQTTEEEAPAAQWTDIEARSLGRTGPAGSRAATEGEAAKPAQPGLPGVRQADAANDAPGRWPWGWAAMALVALGMVTLLPQWIEEPASRGVREAPASAQWRVADPQGASSALAAELRGLSAQVLVKSEGDAFVLEIAAPAAAAEKVNERLVPLETALDRQGRLVLRVTPLR